MSVPAKLEGKVAFITGAARGMGRSHAVVLAAAGADIIAVDLCADVDAVPYGMSSRADLEETGRQVEAAGRRASLQVADVRSYAELSAAATAGVEELGRLDIVVANAGVIVQELGVPGWEMSEDRWRMVLDTNLTGAWLTLKATVPALLAGGRGGSIVIISSTAGLRGMANIADYSAAKHGQVGLMRAFAQELAPHEIRVNSIHPPGVKTPMIENEMMDIVRAGSASLEENFTNLLPVDALQPSDVSEAVLWLVSDASRYVTSVALPVDAGFTGK